jgi:GNAT superfamily N-acetyltransferase/tetratricopeptide (TPR) repeat protein
MWGVSRLGKALGGLVDMVEAPPEFLWDIGQSLYATAPGGPELENGFWGTVFGDMRTRGGQFIGGAFGPEGFGGQVAGGIPQPVRNPVSRVFFGTTEGQSIDRPGFGMDEAFDGGIFGFAEGVGREFIREPLATAMTASSLAASETWGGDGSGLLADLGGLGQFFRGETWKKAHEISQTRSLGQAVALGILSKDILDEDEVAKVQGSAWYSVISGGFDAAARIYLDTDTFAGGFGMEFYKAAKPGSKSVAIATQREADALRKIGKFNKVADRKLAAAEKAAVEARGEAVDVGKVLKIPATNRLEHSIATQTDDLTSFFGEKGASVGVAKVSDPDMRRAVYQLMGDDAARALDDAVNQAAQGHTQNLHKWTQRHGLNLPKDTIAKAADDATPIYDALAKKVADRKGYNALSFVDEAGDEVGLLEIGNREVRFGISDRARKKFETGDLGRFETAKLSFESWRRGGFEAALAHAEGNAERMSRILKTTREEFVNSKQWKQTDELLAALHYDPEVMASELSARTQRQLARRAAAAGVTLDDAGQVTTPFDTLRVSSELAGTNAYENTLGTLRNMRLRGQDTVAHVNAEDAAAAGLRASGDNVLVYLDAQGVPQGFLTYDFNAEKVFDVYVSPEARRQGISQKLYGAAEDAGVDPSLAKTVGPEGLTAASRAARQKFSRAKQTRTPVEVEAAFDRYRALRRVDPNTVEDLTGKLASYDERLAALRSQLDELGDDADEVFAQADLGGGHVEDYSERGIIQDEIASLESSRASTAEELKMRQASRDHALSATAEDATEADELLEAFNGEGSSMGWARRAEVIRDRFFHDMAEGDLLASWFASAYTSGERTALMRFVMGDMPSIETLRTTNAGLARQIETVAMRRQLIRLYPDNAALIDPIEEFRLFNDPAKWGQNEGLSTVLEKGYKVEVQDVLDDIEAFVGRGPGAMDGPSSASLELQRLMVYAGASDDFMKATLRGRARNNALRGGGIIQKVWQSPYNKTRVVFDMVAHPFIGVDDPMVVPKLKRHLRDAGFDTAEIEEQLGLFSAIRWQDDSRKRFLDGMVRDGVAKLAAKHGIDDPELVEEVLARVSRAAKEGSLYAGQAVKYAGVDRLTGKNFSRVSLVDPITGAVEHVFQPLTPEQLQNAHLMPNFRMIDKAMKRIGEGHKATALRGKDFLMQWPGMAAEQINRIWKPTVLLRPAWPMRVVFDEQLRMMSVLGVMNNLAEFPARFRDLKMQYMRELFPMKDKDRNVLWMGVDDEGKMATTIDPGTVRSAAKVADPTKARNRTAVAGAAAGFGVAGPIGGIVGGALGARMGARGADLANGLQLLHNSSTQNLVFDGYNFMTAFGAPGDRAELFLDEVSAGRQLNHLVMQDRAVEALNRLKLDPRRWRSLDPDDAGYARVWDQAVNRQFRGSPFSRLLWDDTMDEEDIVAWLKGEIALGQGQTYSRRAGRETLRSMPKYRQENPEEWVSEARAYINTNLIPPLEETAELRARLAAGDRVDLEDVREALARHNEANAREGLDELTLGSVHGQEIIEVMDKGSELSRRSRQMLDNAFVHLGKTPTDTLSRQPYFKAIYQGEIQKQVARIKSAMDGDSYRMGERELRNMEDAARKVALHKTRTLLYDLAEESQFAQVVRNMMPFFNAWQEVLTRYAGIALDNPLYMSRLAKAYEAPSKLGEGNFMGSYEDEYGNDFIRFRIPSVGKALLNQGFFASAVDNQGYVMFDRRGLNMLAQGIPSFGPIVAYPVAEVAADRPELEESLSFMFPYGVPQGLKEAFLPAAAKRLVSSATEDKAFAIAEGRIAVDKLVTAELAGDPIDFTDPEVSKKFFSEVKTEAKAFFAMRTVAGMVSPLAPMYQSPYQDAIDDFRRLQREDPNTADEKFLAQYGPEYFAITQSMSRTIDGVPATIPAEQARAKYESLIEAYPEFGSLVIGTEGGGVGVKFSRAIYDKQFQETVSEGDPRARREVRPLTEIVTDPDRRLGWQKWSKFYDWKVDQFARLGITSSSSAQARPIMAIQQVFIDQLRQAHPSWFEDFADRDETKWIRRIDAFRHITESDIPELKNRPDIAGLKKYLDTREQIERVLQARDAGGGSGDLTATSNRDLFVAWETLQTQMIERNPAFSDLHGRWLIDDTVARDSWKAVASG